MEAPHQLKCKARLPRRELRRIDERFFLGDAVTGSCESAPLLVAAHARGIQFALDGVDTEAAETDHVEENGDSRLVYGRVAEGKETAS